MSERCMVGPARFEEYSIDTHLKHMNFLDKLICFSFGTPNTMVDFVAAYRKGSYLNYHANEYIKIVKEFT